VFFFTQFISFVALSIYYLFVFLFLGIGVVFASKGPIALAYSSLKELANQHNTHIKFSATFCGGLPVRLLFCLSAKVCLFYFFFSFFLVGCIGVEYD
jgi:hypothetical protein